MGKEELCASDVIDICEVDCLECECAFGFVCEANNATNITLCKAQLLLFFSKTTSRLRILQ